VLLPLNVRLRPEDLIYILNDAAAQVLIVGPEFVDLGQMLRAAVPGLHHLVAVAADVPARVLAYESWLAAAPATAIPYDGVDERAVAELFYTSGTTGRPKGVELTHRNLYLHALGGLATLPATDRDVALLGTVPLFHVNAWGFPHFMVAVGATMSVIPRFDPGWVCQAVARDGVTGMALIPLMLAALLQYPARRDYDLSSLQKILLGGAPCPPSLITAARQELGVDCYVGYGLTETCPLVSVAYVKSTLAGDDPAAADARRAMTGLPAVGVEVRVVDDQGQDVPADGEHLGEIVVRGDNVMRGYHNQPDETARALAGGWFHTGDLATMDDEGYLQIKDRKKDVIISGGENISSVEIEDALYAHPAVLEAAVIAIPDAKWGEVPLALIVLKPGHSISEAEMLDFAADRLPRFQCPKAVEFCLDLPKTGTGKIIKTALREKYWQGLAARVQ
jgi:fatty-acyl-CoA synthase